MDRQTLVGIYGAPGASFGAAAGWFCCDRVASEWREAWEEGWAPHMQVAAFAGCTAAAQSAGAGAAAWGAGLLDRAGRFSLGRLPDAW